ncbi:MAG: thioredoxin domain-containing protein [Bacteroidales bacterium]|nr:thioredoxin domain-containing protein [Bacteroidales bacterium]
MPDKYTQNNLNISSSPYLRQHAGNPIWWQEWNSETLAYAAAANKPLLVSVGYATCHWCHVMAAEAFSDPETAAYLNANFVNIKVDREQRPDIDQYLMNFIQAQTGSGGWPLNVFLTPGLKPVHALTYAPLRTSGNRYSFLYIAQAVTEFMEQRGDNIMPFTQHEQEAPEADAERLAESLGEYFDRENGGFGAGQKFPPHSTLLFMLYRLSVSPDKLLDEMVTSTLDAMMMRGLHDHLQGGIYRYCVDREWTIPHFEKMLYDQAMALWTYSVAHRVTGGERYRIMAEKIVRCLDDTFTIDGMYASAFNADTDHKEGATYLWSMKELAALLSAEEMERFREVYDVSDTGNFEGLNHLVRKSDRRIDDIEEKLLKARRQRSQPSRDDKILLGLNALTAVALIQAGRQLDRPELAAAAAGLTWRLLETFWDGSSLAHSYYDGVLQQQSYLSDAAAMLLAITMLYEDDHSWGEMMNAMADYVRRFHGSDGRWIESDAGDFMKIYASWFDHPVPSAVSLAETALTRVALLTGADLTPAIYRRPYQSDFYNINVLLTEDLFYLYTTRDPLPWSSIPVNSLQRRGEPESVCYDKVCRTAGLQDRTTERSGSPY